MANYLSQRLSVDSDEASEFSSDDEVAEESSLVIKQEELIIEEEHEDEEENVYQTPKLDTFIKKEGAGSANQGVPLAFQRKSVICSIKDIEVDREAEASDKDEGDGDDSSPGSSLVLEEDSDCEEEGLGSRGPKNVADSPGLQECEPSLNPSEVECVATDTSDDEDLDEISNDGVQGVKKISQAFVRGKSDPHFKAQQFECGVCDSVFEVEDYPEEVLKHMQTVHKFAMRCATQDSTQDPLQEAPALPDPQPLSYSCMKEPDGCGAVFLTRRGMSTHLLRAQSDRSKCWMSAVQAGEQSGFMLSCMFCSVSCVSRRELLKHLKLKHGSTLDQVKPSVAALVLNCRICEKQFCTVRERNQHEVARHTHEAGKFLMRCHVCHNLFSSKVCLKKHFTEEHSDDESFYNGLSFRCKICGITYPTYLLIQNHCKTDHPSSLVFKCQHCSSVLKTKKSFQAHLKGTQCGSVRQECTICNKVMLSKRALSIHYKMKHANANRVGFLCRICKQRFDSKSDRKQHYASDHQGDSPFHCPICNKGFASKSGMYGHRQTHAKTGLSKCQFCGKEFSRRDSYNEHLLIHNGPRHKCPHCDKEFVQRSNLVRHIRIHTGEKPYKCSFCDKTFSDKGACNSHIRVHTREEACSCPYCGQVFSKKQKLKYHIRKHTGEGLVSCEFCGKTFTNSHSLKEHRMIHDRRTQILCSHCGKAFTTAKYLQRHIAMVHEAIFIFNCPLCSRGFSQQGRLKTHLMTHTGVKHLRCLLCTKAYSSRKSLRRHLLNMHGIPIEHPDYNRCFYAMTPEEVGLSLPETQATPARASPTTLPVLKPKSEPLSADSDSDGSSEDEEGSDEPPRLEREEPYPSVSLHVQKFPGVRTKAAMKQLPFNVIVSDERVGMKPKGRSFPTGLDKLRATKQSNSLKSKKDCEEAEGVVRSLRNATPRKKFHDEYRTVSSIQSGSSRTQQAMGEEGGHSSEQDSWRPGKSKPKKKSVPQETDHDCSSIAGQEILITEKKKYRTDDSDKSAKEPVKSSNTTEPSKSNRRARYKLQTPKKLIIQTESDTEDIYFYDDDDDDDDDDRNAGQQDNLPHSQFKKTLQNQTFLTGNRAQVSESPDSESESTSSEYCG